MEAEFEPMPLDVDELAAIERRTMDELVALATSHRAPDDGDLLAVLDELNG
jgi:hypothetical protein